MKNKFISIALASCLAGTASAQMAFQSGVIDFSYGDIELEGPAVILNFGGRADYDIGAFGLQIDGSALIIADFPDSVEQYSIGVHVNRTLSNGIKLGGFAGVETLSLSGPYFTIYNVGAEAMMSFGAFDVEAAIGNFFGNEIGDIFWRAEVDLYYEISPAFEISLGVDQLFNAGFTNTFYTAGASYQLPNMPLSIGAKYYAADGFDRIEFVASYEFGDPNNERLFQSRSFPLFFGGN